MESSRSIDIAKRYTDETYANRDEVRKGLNTSLVDPFWNMILSYRSQYAKAIRLSSTGPLTYSYCYTPAIVEKSANVVNRLSHCLSVFAGLDEQAKSNVRFKCAFNALAYVGQVYGETLTSDFVSTVISEEAHNLQGLSVAKQKTVNYYDAYKCIRDKHVSVDEDLLVRLYVEISKKEITSSNYRNFDFATNNANVINPMRDGVPFTRISEKMDQLYMFLKDNTIPLLSKAAAAYFYINYVKPFSEFNNEIALLVFKAVIGNDEKEQIGYLLPFEELLKQEATFANDFKEVNRGNDLTYVLMRIVNNASGVIETFLDNCTNTQIDDLRHEHAPKADNSSLESASEPKTLENNEKPVNPVKETIGSVAVQTIESGLEEKDAHKFEKFLLEKNPLLKPTQAHFYARHCTIGSYYTIQMYKKAERVVYETARTSMDALASFGLYKKEQIKNKFVYTPVKLKEEEKK